MHNATVGQDHLSHQAAGWTGLELWFHHVATVLSRPVDQLPSHAWPLLLTRDFPFGLVHPPPETVEIYRHTWWERLPPRTPVELRVGIRWSEPRPGSTRVAVETRAYGAGTELAGAVAVLHLPGDVLPASGEPHLPPAPSVPRLEPVRTSIVGAHEVHELEAVLDRRSPLTDSASFAHRQGFPAALTPGLLLLNHAYDRDEPWGERGTVEMWLQRPIPLGAVIEVCRAFDDPDVVALRLLRQAQPAVVLRRRNEVERP